MFFTPWLKPPLNPSPLLTRRCAVAGSAPEPVLEPQLKGLSGRSRRANSFHDRCRDSVRKNIDRALEAIQGGPPELHLHLRNAIRTGSRCCYAPDRPIEWVLK